MRLLRVLVAAAATLAVAGPACAATDPISIVDQTDGINSKRVTTVALYCHKVPCAGTLRIGPANFKFGNASFSIPASTTGKVPVKLTKDAFQLVKDAPKRKMKVLLTVTLAPGQVFTHRITLKA